MKKLRLFIFFLGIATVLIAVPSFFALQPGQSNSQKVNNQGKEENMSSSSSSYASLWTQVEGFIEKGLPKSALEVVEKIYTIAKQKKDAGQLVKALIHKVRIIQEVDEATFSKIQKELLEELKNSQFPVTPLLHSMLGELYWNYYNQNRYLFLNRTETSKEFKEDDVQTWDLRRIVEQVIFHYEKSLENPEKLKATRVDVFDEVINKQPVGRKFRPTLYDFLAHRAVDFYMDSEAGLTKPRYEFTLNNPDYFLPGERFAKLVLSTKDPLSFDFLALKHLQELIQFHLSDRNPDALIDVDLKRLRYVYSQAVISDKESIYEKTLKAMLDKYSNSPISAEITYELALLYEELGNRYRPGQPDTYRWYKKKALELCLAAIQRFPGTLGAKKCQVVVNRIEAKNLQLTLEKAVIKDKPLRGLLAYRNFENIYYKIVSINDADRKSLRQINQDDMVNLLLKKPAQKNGTFQLPECPEGNDYQSHSVEIKFDGLPFGNYVVLLSNVSNFDRKQNVVAFEFFTVTNISYFSRLSSDKGWEFYILDRETGLPLKNALLRVWGKIYNQTLRDYEDRKIKDISPDLNGYVNIGFGSISENNFYVELLSGANHEDRLYTDQNFSLYKPYKPEPKNIQTVFFLDRAIYRPGQTVYFKGIMIELDSQEGSKSRILPNTSSVVTLYDVNNQKVSELKLTTNEYGTFSGSFSLPFGLLTGAMLISNQSGSVGFSMEEYKRPKFSVDFKPPDKSYRLNDVVTVTGSANAYAGYVIDNAEVRYRVVRTFFYPYPWYCYRYSGFFAPSSPSMEISNGVTTTDSNGIFKISFEAIPDLSIPKETFPAFIFTVYADVTDINGETHSGQKAVYLGYTSLKIDIIMPEAVNKDSNNLTVPVSSEDLSGNQRPSEGTISVYKLKEPDRILRKRLWDKPDKFIMTKAEFIANFPYDVYENEDDVTQWEREKKVFSGTYNTSMSKETVLSGMRRWEQGKYSVVMESKDDMGNTVEAVKYFTVYSESSNKMPTKLLSWFYAPKPIVEPGDNAVFMIGSSDRNVRVLYEIEHMGKVIESMFITLNNEQKRIELPIREEYRGNIGVRFTFVKHSRFISFSQNVVVPWSNKLLKLSFGTFRDKLKPGERDEWQIKISGPQGEKVAAEMVAALYDASLDVFRQNEWGFSIYPYHYLSNEWYSNSFFSVVQSSLLGLIQRISSFDPVVYDSLNWFGFYPYWRNGGRGGFTGAIKMAEPGMRPLPAPERAMTACDTSVMAERTDLNLTPIQAKDGQGPIQAPGAAEVIPVQVRRDFKETAFFYPHLRTSPEGDIIIAFTIPEALTKWKMLGFAHTKNLEYGFLSNELITQKDLMVVPNPPRFFREGDTIIFTSKVTNLTENELKGVAELRLFDASTMRPVDALFNNINPQQEFTAGKGQSGLVSWKLAIPDGVDMDGVTYRLTAVAGNFSDGEEQIIPLLKNRMLVTESLPLPVSANQEKPFTFDKLINASQSSTLKMHKLTLEFTSNPVWYAVQALPFLMEFPYECLEQIFSRYFANSVASYIANSNPRIKQVFDLWKQGAEDPNSPNANALLSNLEKNQELKSVLLEETPWVMEGRNESERKRRIALLFDLNNMGDQLARALRSLEDGQLPSGAWPWFKGMPENRYITQHIVSGFAQLGVLNVLEPQNNPRVWNMILKAISYLDKQLTNDYDFLVREKINLNQMNINYTQVHYLYARSYFNNIPMNPQDVKAFDYYKSQGKTYWASFKDNKYIQGLLSLAMKRYGEVQTAVAIVNSIKEYALFSEEMGMYWRHPLGYYWYHAPIETQALLIEVFDEVMNDAKSVEAMKTWLLKQKQTQDWGTTKATVEACYALLLKGTNLINESNPPVITLGKANPVVIEPGKEGPNQELIRAEAGTGYFKVSWDAGQIRPEMGYISVKNNNAVSAWGSLYWQYFENLDKITAAETPLKLSKKLFVERPSDTGPVLHPLDGNTPLNVGDRVKVRIELRVDRDMEYVHMKDLRASAFEPEDVLSYYRWQGGLGYYQSTRDASTNFFFDFLPKGTYVFEYALRATHVGDFSNGVTSIQCMYAPEFASHSEGVRVNIQSR